MIEGVISSKNLNDLLHLKETAWFEFREKHYATTAPNPGGLKAKHELAKDCSSIANSGGGYIFLGLKPAIESNQMTEYVAQVKGITKSDVNLISWRDTLLNQLTPRFTLEEIEHGFIDIDEEKSILWMRIPSAVSKGVYPLMVHNDQVQQGEHTIKGKTIGIYERYGAENIALSTDKVQSYIANGIASEGSQPLHTQAMVRMEAKIDSLINAQTSSAAMPDLTEHRDKFIAEAGIKLANSDNGFFYMYAAPESNVHIANFWAPYSEDNSVPKLLKTPPILRRMGWDLSVASQEYPTAAPGAWEIMNGAQKLLRVTEKGEVAVAVNIKPILSWGLDEQAQQEGYALLINEYALAEFIAMFLAFLNKVADKLNEENTRYSLFFGFAGTSGSSVGLHEPIMQGIPSNPTIGPLRTPSEWEINSLDPDKQYVNAGFVIEEVIRAGFGGSEDSQYFIREEGQLRFDPSSYTG